MNEHLKFRFRILLQTQLIKTDVPAQLAVRLMDQARFINNHALEDKVLDRQVTEFVTYGRRVMTNADPERPSWLAYVEVMVITSEEIHAEFLTLVQTYVLRHRDVSVRDAAAAVDQAFFVLPACLDNDDLDRQAIEFCRYMTGADSRPFWVRYQHEENP